jgi:hypothetical protein
VIKGLRRAGTCASHREAIIAFASLREGGPAVRRALDHVDRCRDCEAELGATTLVVQALRRLCDEATLAQPAADSWERLRGRLVATPRRPSLLVSGIPGLLLALSLCAALAGPSLLGGDGATRFDDGTGSSPTAQAAIRFEQTADRNPAPSSIRMPIDRPTPPLGRADDLARAVVALRAIPPATPVVDVPAGGLELAPAGADRR